MVASTPLVRPDRQAGRIGFFSRLSVVRTVFNANWFRALLIAVAGIVVHAPALQGQRIWDDQYLSHDNPFIKSPFLIPETFRHYLFLDSYSAHYRPIQNISFMFDYYFWNTDEFGFHLTNVLFHVGSAVLLYFLLRYLFASLVFRNRPFAVRQRGQRLFPWISHAALLVSLLWVVHPVHSAAVDYISGRADSIAFFFAAAGWLLFGRAQLASARATRLTLYLLAAVSGLVALLSREIACIWILLFLIHLFAVEKKFTLRTRVVAACCCFVLIGIYAGLRHLPEQRITAQAQKGWSAPVRAQLMARALGDYARLMIFPDRLHMERTVFDGSSCRNNAEWRKTIGLEYLSIFGLGLFAIFLFGSFWKGRGRAARIFGAGWFLAGYLPISNLVQLNATAAEHWLYLPSVGFLIFLAGCVLELPARGRSLVVSTAALAVLALGTRSFVRSGDWSNEETFYKRTLDSGGISGRVAVNLAQVYVRRGDYAAAEKLLRALLQSTPDYPTGRNTLAALLNLEGKKKEAEELLAMSVKFAPQARRDYPRTWVSALALAQLRHEAKDDQGAIKILAQARADYPQVWDLVSFESELRRVTEGPDAALPIVEDFVRTNWWHHGAVLALGHLYAQKNEPERAEAALRLASKLDVHDAEALRLIALMRVNQHRLEDAFEFQRRAIARQPDQPSQYALLSNILEQMGRNDEAQAALAEAARLRGLVNHQRAVN